ncbi:MAG: hypothetical protein AB1758_00915, partial [Candidatus Eremiobacterota bacterium]
LAASFLLAFVLGQEDDPNARMSALLDPRVLSVCAHRLAGLLADTPGDLLERFTTLARTVQNALEEGNRRIFTDIGVAGQDFLTARRAKGGALSADECCALSPDHTRARAVYDRSLAFVDAPGPVPQDIGAAYPGLDSTAMLGAGFALFEEAGRSRGERRGRLIVLANNLLAHHEQFTIVQPAFTPPQKEGEVDRESLFRILTPTVGVKTRSGNWRYSEFARQLPPRDHNPFTPRVTEYNWATFSDRWAGILDFFAAAYRHPEGCWPMPSPDPAEPL